MRILFGGQVGESLPPPFGGVPKRALMLAKIWKSQGHVVGLCFTHQRTQADDLGAEGEYYFEYAQKPGMAAKIIFILRATVSHPMLYAKLMKSGAVAFGGLSKDVVLYSAYGVFFQKVVAQFLPDVIVAESGLARSFFAAKVAQWNSVPFVLEPYAEVQDPSVIRFSNETVRAAYWRYFFSLCARVIAASAHCSKGPLMFAQPESVRIVYATTLEVDIFEKDVRTLAEGRSFFQLPQEMFLVAAVGAYSPRKGHDHLIRAAAKARKRGHNIGVMLCGEGNYAWLQELAEECGMKDYVFIFQNLSEEELRLFFKSADLYCDASNTPRACLGIALTEALASGIPAVAYDTGGLPEVVAPGTGFLVPLDDISALAETIIRIYQATPDERSELGKNGRIRAKTTFDLPHIAGQLMGELHLAYQSALHEKNL